jgi:hypothetical protein
MTTTSPGSVDEADGETREPTGSGSLDLGAEGRSKVNVSGDGEVEV